MAEFYGYEFDTDSVVVTITSKSGVEYTIDLGACVVEGGDVYYEFNKINAPDAFKLVYGLVTTE